MQKYVNKNLFKKIFSIEIYAHNSRLKLFIMSENFFPNLCKKTKLNFFEFIAKKLKHMFMSFLSEKVNFFDINFSFLRQTL